VDTIIGLTQKAALEARIAKHLPGAGPGPDQLAAT